MNFLCHLSRPSALSAFSRSCFNFTHSRPIAFRHDNLLPSSSLARRNQFKPGYASYSSITRPGQLADPAELDSTQLSVQTSATPQEMLPPEKLVFGHTFTDHMLAIQWTATGGWQAPEIKPFQNLSLNPATNVFQYAYTCFDGFKAYRGGDGVTRLFRADKNMERLNRSAARLSLPTFHGPSLLTLVKKLVNLDQRFVPELRGYSLYLRPTIIGTQPTLGVSPTGSALLYVICSPVGPYYPEGFKAISLEATTYAVRAWPGGTGDAKWGGNYAPCVVPQVQAARSGFNQNLWLFGPEEYITEVGMMNLFVVLRNADGQLELATPPLDGTILPGVTRDSVLQIARERLEPEGWRVQERRMTMRELADAASSGRLVEVFGAGTAAVISPVRNIGWRGQNIPCGLAPDAQAGPTAQRLKSWIEEIQYGDRPHPWADPI